MIRHGPNSLEGPFARTSFLHGASQTSEPKTSQNTSSKSAQSASTPPEDRAIRWDLVERVRSEIAAGTYETAEKWEAALEQLFRRVEQQ
jgi:hypothetical protein